MPRFILDLTRTDLQTPGGGGAPVIIPDYWNNDGYLTRNGEFDIKLPGELLGVTKIAVEGYTINGVGPVDTGAGAAGLVRPAQNYLMLQFDRFRAYDDEVMVAAASKDDADVKGRVDQGFPLSIDTLPVANRTFDQPATRLIFIADRPQNFHSLRVRVTGPNNSVPQFTKMTIFLRIECKADTGLKSALPLLYGNHDSELPPGDYPHYSTGGQRGAIHA